MLKIPDELKNRFGRRTAVSPHATERIGVPEPENRVFSFVAPFCENPVSIGSFPIFAPVVPGNLIERIKGVVYHLAEKLKIIPLGGLNEIGKNITVLEYGKDMIVVDCGVGFPEEDMYGVDLVIPDFTYLVKNQGKLRGFFITHGHEDHIGSLPYALQQVLAPVHVTPMTGGLIRLKLEEHGLADQVKLVTHQPGDVVKAGCFQVEFIHVNHSIADAVCFCIHTPVGRVVMTGDFKIDPTAEGGMMDLGRLGVLGKEGVLALLCDSTNVERTGYTPSEQVVAEGLDRQFKNCSERIIVTTFASGGAANCPPLRPEGGRHRAKHGEHAEGSH